MINKTSKKENKNKNKKQPNENVRIVIQDHILIKDKDTDKIILNKRG